MANIKRALLTSALAIIACVAMPIGSTFAWFNDTASTGENRIEAGRLAVDLLMYKDGKYQSIKDGEGDIFCEGTVAQNDVDTLWEPGKTQIVYLGVRNNGNLALKYNIWLRIKNGGKVKLNEVMEYAILDGVTYEQAQEMGIGSYAEIKALDGVQTGVLPEGDVKTAERGCLDETVNGVKDEVDYFALAVHMKEEAGNEYQDADLTIDVTVVAGQASAESDSFGKDYDLDAKYAEYEVESGSELLDTLDQINTLPGNATAKIVLKDDVKYDEETIEISNGNDVTIDLNGNNLDVTNYEGDHALVVSDGGTLTG